MTMRTQCYPMSIHTDTKGTTATAMISTGMGQSHTRTRTNMQS